MRRFSSYKLLAMLTVVIGASLFASTASAVERHRAIGQGPTIDDAYWDAHNQMNSILLSYTIEGLLIEHTIIREQPLTPSIYLIEFEVSVFGDPDDPNGSGEEDDDDDDPAGG